jgi:hypothetical protein
MRGRPTRRGLNARALVITSIVGLVAVTSMALVAPAGAKDAFERRIRRAAEATTEAGTARVALQVAIDSGAVSGELTADGVVSLTGDRGQLVIDLSELTGAAASFEERIVDGVIYIDFGSILDATGSVLPAELLGKRWVSVDISSLTGPDGESLRSIDPTGGANPTSQLDALRGIDDAVRVGAEDIDGVRTTHFRGALRLALAREHLDAVPDALRAQVEAGLEQMFRGDRKLPVDLWLDAENRLRQMRTRIDVEEPEQARVTVTLTMPEFDVPVEVAAPPAEETIDFGEFQQLLGP